MLYGYRLTACLALGACLSGASVAAPPRASAATVTADWTQDAPGRKHRVRAQDLPAPFATPSAGNPPRIVPRPASAQLHVPHGFRIDTFAADLQRPRKMLQAPNGDILVTEISAGRVMLLHPSADGSHAQQVSEYASGLKAPFGLAFYPNSKSPQWLYVAETHRVIRYAYQTGDLQAHAEPEIVVAELPHGGGHATRDIAFSADGTRLYVSVGSASNVAETMSKKTPQEIAEWQARQGVGAAWDEETHRAVVLSFDATTPGEPATFVTGVRNCVGLTLQPANGSIWCTTNERDGLGDDLVPDYSTRLTPGGFYGWPWYYLGAHEDPRLAGQRPDLQSHVLVPSVLYQAHSAALTMTFYSGGRGRSAFPDDFVGDAFVAFHGSWNRELRTGYKLVRVRMAKGDPTGVYEDFVTGFVVDNQSVWGRPVATLQLDDGSLLLSDDAANAIYRISRSR